MKNKLFIVTGTSAAGKTTIALAVLKKDKNLKRSLTYTTRPLRKNERNHQDYNFISVAEFQKKLKQGEFLEHANNYGNWYGTNKKDIQAVLNSGKSALIVTDIKGALAIKKVWPNKTTTIFIAPEKLSQLTARFKKRKDTSPQQEKIRLETARWELAQADKCDFLIINRQNKIKQAVAGVLNIIQEQTKKKP